jgi:hypothetical protein
VDVGVLEHKIYDGEEETVECEESHQFPVRLSGGVAELKETEQEESEENGKNNGRSSREEDGKGWKKERRRRKRSVCDGARN